MSAKYSDIISAIDTIISGITEVKAHYQYEPQQITAYPAVTISPQGHTDQFLSLRDTKREYAFTVRVWGQMESTRNDTQIVVRDIAEKIIDKLTSSTNITLGGVVEFSTLTSGKFLFVQRESSIYVFETTYKAVVTINRETS